MKQSCVAAESKSANDKIRSRALLTWAKQQQCKQLLQPPAEETAAHDCSSPLYDYIVSKACRLGFGTHKGIPVEQATAAFAFTLSPTGLVRVPFKRRAERERRIISMAPTEISSTDSRVGFAPDSFFLAFCYMHTASSSMFDSRISSLQLPKVQLCFTTPSVW